MPKNTTPKKLPTTVTLRQIEAAVPCIGEYLAFCADIKSNPIKGGDWLTQRPGISYYKFRRPAFGPDDPIPLTLILDADWTGKVLTPAGRIRWLLENVRPALTHLATAINDLERQIATDVRAYAVREVLRAAGASRLRR